jgi:signal transduction histidine kinase
MALPLEQRNNAAKRLVIIAGWAATVLLFASQWYAYDAGHGFSDPLVFYLGWSCYLWGILTPLAVWLAWRYPIQPGTWKRAVPLHLLVSILLTTIQLSAEASIAWLRHSEDGTLTAMLAHYLRQHMQIGLLTYWFLLGATHFYRIYDQDRKRQLRAAQLGAQLAEAQMENLRTQLHPHFLFNTLQAAVTLIHEDPQGAEDILLRLSELLRVSLDEMRTHEIQLAREMEFLGHYIDIQQRRFDARLRFEVHIDPTFLDCAVPTLILQPLVENAVRHGVGKHKDTDVITVRAFQEQERLYLEVANFSSSLEDTPERLFSRGVGLSNARGRLEQLYGREQSLRLFNLEPTGVCVQISIPMRRLPSGQNVPPKAVTV